MLTLPLKPNINATNTQTYKWLLKVLFARGVLWHLIMEKAGVWEVHLFTEISKIKKIPTPFRSNKKCKKGNNLDHAQGNKEAQL